MVVEKTAGSKWKQASAQAIHQYIHLANDANSHQLEKLPLRLQEAEGKGQRRVLQHALYDRRL
jgi:hypothetical protein